MPSLTGQIIRNIVKEEVKSSSSDLKGEITEIKEEIGVVNRKIDKVMEQLTDIAGQFKKFDEEQTVLSGQMSDRTDRIEKLEVSVFGTAAA